MRRFFNLHLVILALVVAPFVYSATKAFAQAGPVNPTTPGYMIERNNQGYVQQFWQSTTPTQGLPVKPIAPSSIAATQVTVLSKPTSVIAARAGRTGLTITNLGTTDVFCGGTSGVLITTGDLIAGVKGTTKTYDTAGQVYCIVGTGTQVVSVVETY